MRPDLFEELLESVREGGAILRGETAPSLSLEVESNTGAVFKVVGGMPSPRKEALQLKPRRTTARR